MNLCTKAKEFSTVTSYGMLWVLFKMLIGFANAHE